MMVSRFPQMPNPYSQYGYMSVGQRPQMPNQQQMADQLANSIMGQPAQNVAQGASQLVAGAGLGLRKFMQGKNGQFPAVPGGAQPSFMTGLANLFTGQKNGGLY